MCDLVPSLEALNAIDTSNVERGQTRQTSSASILFGHCKPEESSNAKSLKYPGPYSIHTTRADRNPWIQGVLNVKSQKKYDQDNHLGLGQVRTLFLRSLTACDFAASAALAEARRASRASFSACRAVAAALAVLERRLGRLAGRSACWAASCFAAFSAACALLSCSCTPKHLLRADGRCF